MTTLAAWAAIDTHGVSSLYFCSDSRVSWGSHDRPGFKAWDYAPKVFHCQNYPDMFGYAGSSFAITKILSQVITLADSGALFSENASADERIDIVSQQLKKNLSAVK